MGRGSSRHRAEIADVEPAAAGFVSEKWRLRHDFVVNSCLF
jgi:hypothetical protein